MSESNLPYELNDPYILLQPLDVEDARKGSRALVVQRRQARKMLENSMADAADAERDYRRGRKTAYANNTGGTADARKALVDDETADLARDRDFKAALVKVRMEHLAEIDGERALFNRLIEWSKALDPFAQENRQPGSFDAGRSGRRG